MKRGATSQRKDIVAVMINGTTITNDRKKILAALELELPVGGIPREIFEFMAKLDLGPKWEALAKAETLFYLDDDGRICGLGI